MLRNNKVTGILACAFILLSWMPPAWTQSVPSLPGDSIPHLPITGGASGWTDDGTVVRLTTPTDKVGIGTIEPNGALDVNGNVVVTTSGQYSGALSIIGTDRYEGGQINLIDPSETEPHQSYGWLVDSYGNPNNDLYDFRIFHRSSTQHKFILRDDRSADNNDVAAFLGMKVGIGTSDPISWTNLDIYDDGTNGGSGDAYIRLRGTGSGYNFSGINFSSDEPIEKQWEFVHKQEAVFLNHFQLAYHNGSYWSVYLDATPSGDIGIGTTDPQAKLDVNGSIKIGSEVLSTDAATGTITFDDDYIYVKTSTGWKRARLCSFDQGGQTHDR